MKVILAGYNIDSEVIEDLKKTSHPRADVTPETLSAAYARVSRDPRSVDELRKIACQEVEKARKSNQNIIFNMGHHSVAEHAVFNFDIIDVSRLAIEDLEKFRLCSYTEKSQRYQSLEDNFVMPAELKGTEFEKDFIKVINEQNELYGNLKTNLAEKYGELANEDARYITSLATCAQLGMTMNARNLELIFRRLASNPLCEVFTLGKEMFSAVEKIAPSIILFTSANDLDVKTYGDLEELTGRRAYVGSSATRSANVNLVEHTKNPDDILVSSLLHTSSGSDYKKCRQTVKKMTFEEKKEIVKTACRHMKFYDSTIREFEHIYFTFDIVLSAACFGQLKRHRMGTITCQKYNPKLGLTIPPSIIEIGMEKPFKTIAKRSEKLFYRIYEKIPHVAPYVLTNAHRKRVLLTINARELYHVSRLREDTHAQWDIKDISTQMTIKARDAAPLSMLLIGGKDSYDQIFERAYNV